MGDEWWVGGGGEGERGEVDCCGSNCLGGMR